MLKYFQNKYEEKWSSGWPVDYNHFDSRIAAIQKVKSILRLKENLWIPVNCESKYSFICETNSGKLFYIFKFKLYTISRYFSVASLIKS